MTTTEDEIKHANVPGYWGGKRQRRKSRMRKSKRKTKVKKNKKRRTIRRRR